jgi:hypothetical protein
MIILEISILPNKYREIMNHRIFSSVGNRDQILTPTMSSSSQTSSSGPSLKRRRTDESSENQP